MISLRMWLARYVHYVCTYCIHGKCEECKGTCKHCPEPCGCDHKEPTHG